MCHLFLSILGCIVVGCLVLEHVFEPHYKHASSLAFFCETLQQGDTQQKDQRTQRPHNASYVWRVSDAREGSKYLRVTQYQHILWVVSMGVFEATTLKSSFGKSQIGVVVVAS